MQPPAHGTMLGEANFDYSSLVVALLILTVSWHNHFLSAMAKRESPKLFAENAVRHDIVDKVDFCRGNSSDNLTSQQRRVIAV